MSRELAKEVVMAAAAKTEEEVAVLVGNELCARECAVIDLPQL